MAAKGSRLNLLGVAFLKPWIPPLQAGVKPDDSTDNRELKQQEPVTAFAECRRLLF